MIGRRPETGVSVVDGGQPGGGWACGWRALRAEDQQLERKAIGEAGDVGEEGWVHPKGCVLPSSFSGWGPAGVHGPLFRKNFPKPVPAPCRQPLLQPFLALGTESWPKFLANPALFLVVELEEVMGWAPPKESPLGSQETPWEPHLLAGCGGLSPDGHT